MLGIGTILAGLTGALSIRLLTQRSETPTTTNSRTLPLKIDTHHHFVPDFYRQAIDAAGGDPAGFPTPNWTLQTTLDNLQINGVRKAYLSLTSPGPTIAGPNTTTIRQLARQANEYAAALAAAHPTQLGFFASLPSPLDDPSGTLAEITYALDTLHADGVTLFTRYGPDNHYLGHPAFRPLWETLNARRAVVFIHPTTAACNEWINPVLPPPMLDFPAETTRSAIDMIMGNVTRDFPDAKRILSHAGGTLPFLISRVAVTARAAREQNVTTYGKTYAEWVEGVRSFYYDLALVGTPGVMDLVWGTVDPGKVVYGSDFPYANADKVAGYREYLDEYVMDEELRAEVYFRNAERLLG
ncbi:2-amino-3-carboxymuconate-6-semialdehyde decarboxylase [Aspergillus uvarum CBS 121591]|uniref:6-methylsalicylate decarboxylase n=1 Tax=Aspergillus uvarum CBS 121591 TaxID=1448315 RepID=A0A319CQB4_9EURO|nr:2-amino-3-carboxymuconate-6-semialdehyde decarboxylase [Aspergillus uvarum CBS 121591]PYH86780.1 2-amino-3-carboxymuconate-6-semialdehyde decarboxylase [Aspergillus uvarum CBS 121591]